MSEERSATVASRLPIRARLVAMSERTRAQLEYHFDHDGRRVFTIAASVESADVLIVDCDHPGARADIERGRWRDGPPLMVLIHGEDKPAEALVALRKPLDRARLDAAALGLLADAHEVPPATGEASGSESPLPAGAAAEVHEEDESEGEGDSRGGDRGEAVYRPEAIRRRRRAARVAMLCGPPRSALDIARPDDAEHRHDPSRFPLAHLLRARRSAGADVKGLSLAFDGIEVYVLPWLHRVLTTVSLQRRDNVERLFRPFEDEEVEVTFHPLSSVNTLVDRANERARHAFSPESASWLFSLFAARGRLPFGVDVECAFRLRHWPNLTRLERTPEAIRIAALWSERPISIAATISRLGCEPRFVTAFHVGAAASGLIEPGEDVTHQDERDT